MIFIIHGQNVASSRKLLLQIHQKFNEPSRIELNYNDTTPSQLKDAVSTFDIFQNPSMVVLDITGATGKKQNELIEVIKEAPSESIIVIYSSKELTKSNVFLKAGAELKAKILFMSQEKETNIFNFVDAVFDKNRKRSYVLLNSLIREGQDPFYLFSMLLYGLRNVAYFKFDAPHFAKSSPFVVSKAQRQAKNFSKNQIMMLFDKFYDFDKKVKTGGIDSQILVPLAIEQVLK